jgi:PTS system mannose-specific IIC component
MWIELLVIAVWGGIVSLDTTAALQGLISHPLVSCTITGLLLGNVALGLFVGIVLELLWLGELPIGAAYFAESNLGATAAAAIAVISAQLTGRPTVALALALILSVVISLIGGKMVVLLRNHNGRVYQKLINSDTLTIHTINKTHFQAIALSFLSGAVLVALCSGLLGWLILPVLIQYLPVQADSLLEPVAPAFLGLGCGVLISLFISRKNWTLLVFGLALGAGLLLLG